MLSANPAPLQVEDGWSVNGVGRHYSHKFGYGLMDAGAIVDLALRWPGIGKQVKPICDPQFMDVFNALHRLFEVLLLVWFIGNSNNT